MELCRAAAVAREVDPHMRIPSPASFNREGKAIVFCLIAVAKEVVVWTREKGMRTETFRVGKSLTDFF